MPEEAGPQAGTAPDLEKMAGPSGSISIRKCNETFGPSRRRADITKWIEGLAGLLILFGGIYGALLLIHGATS